MKKKILSIFLSLALLIVALPFSNVNPTALDNNCQILGHSYGEWENIQEANCFEEGIKSRTCSVCGETEDEIIPTTEHTFVEWETAIEVSCELDGEKYSCCEICGEEGIIITPAIGHNYGEWVIIEPVTCAYEGYMERCCLICGDSEMEEIPIDENAHVYEIIEQVLPTLTEDGYETKECDYCGFEVTETLPAMGTLHSYDVSDFLEPTCVQDGYAEYTCSTCGEVYKEVIPATGEHEYLYTYRQEPTCTDEGYQLYDCMYCGHEYTEPIPSYGREHNIQNHIRTNADCFNDGYIMWDCSYCGYVYEEIIPKKTHEYAIVRYQEKTCGQDGIEEQRCIHGCGTGWIYTSEATGEHTFGEWVTEKEATCSENGKKIRTCSVCGHTEEESIATNNSHTFGKWQITVAPTCTADGEQTRICSGCNLTQEKAIKAHGHNHSSEWVVEKEATCSETGIKSSVCTICGEKSTMDIALSDHNYGEMVYQIKPTCIQPQIGYHCCVDCGEIEYLSGYADHKFGDWVVTSLPNATLSGEKKHTCSICNHTETEVIPPVKFTLGDTSGDGVVDQNDYKLIVEIVNGTKAPTAEEFYAADINQDGAVDGFDAIYFDLLLNNCI